KEQIIEAAGAANVWGASFAYYATLIGVFVTSLYSFRVYFLVFHGPERFRNPQYGQDHSHDDHAHHGGTPHESPWVVTLPLVVLAVPSVLAGMFFAGSILFGDFFDGVITVSPEHPAMATLAGHWHGWVAYALHGFVTVPFWLMGGGPLVAWYLYVVNPALPGKIYSALSGINRILENKYYADWFNE